MWWICPGCGTQHSIPDCDKERWQTKESCQYCPAGGIKKPVITAFKTSDLTSKTLDKISNLTQNMESKAEVKAFVPASDDIGQVTDDAAKKQFREEGYEGKKRRKDKSSPG